MKTIGLVGGMSWQSTALYYRITNETVKARLGGLQALIHRIIYEELCLGQILPRSHTQYCQIINKLIAAGAETIVLGCTEISLLVKAADVSVPLFDTTTIHAQSAVELALR